MTNQYEVFRKKMLKELEEIEQNINIQKSLNKTLPNSSEETDYKAWLEGSKKFAADNEELLKAKNS